MCRCCLLSANSLHRATSQACARLLEFVRYLGADENRSHWLAEQLAVVAADAPQELLLAIKSAPLSDRPLIVDALVAGLVKAAHPEPPLWPTLRAAQGSPDPTVAEFAREFEMVLSQKIALGPRPAGDCGRHALPSSRAASDSHHDSWRVAGRPSRGRPQQPLVILGFLRVLASVSDLRAMRRRVNHDNRSVVERSSTKGRFPWQVESTRSFSLAISE